MCVLLECFSRVLHSTCTTTIVTLVRDIEIAYDIVIMHTISFIKNVINSKIAEEIKSQTIFLLMLLSFKYY